MVKSSFVVAAEEEEEHEQEEQERDRLFLQNASSELLIKKH